MKTKHVPETLVEQMYDASSAAFKVIFPMVAGRQRLNEEINQAIISEYTHIRNLADELIQNATRRLKSNQSTTEEIEIEDQGTTAQSVEPTPPEVKFTIMDIGRAFKGTRTVRVPVTMRPVMHMSQGGRWSWRTMVAGHNDFRHINVTNFHSSECDNFGNMYAIVDAEWITDQPVFADYCNQVSTHGFSDNMDIPF